MRFITGKGIILGIAGLFLILAIAGWFLFGSNFSKNQPLADAPSGSTVDNGCASVYRRVTDNGFSGLRLMAEPGFKVEKALYLTGRELKASYETEANIQDDSHVCYVVVRGNIDVGSPFTNTVTTYSTGVAIYDPESLMYLEIGSGREIIKVTAPTAGSSRPAAPQ